MERLCKTCNTTHKKAMPYCSLECVTADKEFHEICRTALNLVDASKKCGMSETTFRRVTEELGIKIVRKKKPPRVKVCPKCNKEHTSKYGIHCSQSCANSRIHSEETKKKTSESVKKYFQNNTVSEETRKKQSESLKKHYKNIPKEKSIPIKVCPKCGNEHTSEHAVYCSKSCANSRIHSEETRKKMSESIKEHYKNYPIQSVVTKEQKKANQRVHTAAYRAKKKKAFSPEANHKLIAKIRKQCPKGYHVDHIVPLSKGGLDHEDNLQYLPASENCKKYNRLDYVAQGSIRWQDIIDLTEN